MPYLQTGQKVKEIWIVEELTNKMLNKLPTHRLLVLYKKNRKWKKVIGAMVTDYGNYPEHLDDIEDDEVKLYHVLNKYCKKMKKMLDLREHVET
jgi:hypothetical protein